LTVKNCIHDFRYYLLTIRKEPIENSNYVMLNRVYTQKERGVKIDEKLPLIKKYYEG